MKLGLVALPVMDKHPDGTMRSIGMDMHRQSPPLSIYGLSSLCTSHGYEVAIIDLVAEGRLLNWRDIGELSDCILIGITATSLSWPAVVDAISKVRQALPAAAIVLGGPHPTLFDKYVIERFGVDYVIRGEGEHALVALCECLDGVGSVGDIPNLTWKTADGHARRTAQGTKITRDELERLPLPAYTALPVGIYQGLSLESSRGCPFDCSFCSTNYRKSYRTLTPEHFVGRIAQIAPHVNKTHLPMVNIVDDEFTLNRKRAVKIGRLLEELNPPFQFSYDSRANDLLDDELTATWGPHTYEFFVGAECGYDEGLEKIGKRTTCEKLERAASQLFRRGYAHKAHFSFIIGLPWEELSEVKKTIAFASRLCAEYGIKILLQWYCQIPGSRLWAEARRAGRVSPSLYDDFGFFRNTYLFFSGTQLSPDDVWRVSDIVSSARWALKLRHLRSDPVEHCVPQAVAFSFPRSVGEDRAYTNLVEAVEARGAQQ